MIHIYRYTTLIQTYLNPPTFEDATVELLLATVPPEHVLESNLVCVIDDTSRVTRQSKVKVLKSRNAPGRGDAVVEELNTMCLNALTFIPRE